MSRRKPMAWFDRIALGIFTVVMLGAPIFLIICIWMLEWPYE